MSLPVQIENTGAGQRLRGCCTCFTSHRQHLRDQGDGDFPRRFCAQVQSGGRAPDRAACCQCSARPTMVSLRSSTAQAARLTCSNSLTSAMLLLSSDSSIFTAQRQSRQKQNHSIENQSSGACRQLQSFPLGREKCLEHQILWVSDLFFFHCDLHAPAHPSL